MPAKIELTDEQIDYAMDLFAAGKKHSEVCKEIDISRSTLARLCRNDDEFRLRYLQAKEDAADAIIDEMRDILEDDSWKNHGKMANAAVSKQKLKVDSLKWLAGKMKPKVYGDKIDVNGVVTHQISPLAQLRSLEGNDTTPIPLDGRQIVEAETVESTETEDIEATTEDDCF